MIKSTPRAPAPRRQQVTACLVLKNPRSLEKLGSMPIMEWMLAQLHKVRGIDEIVCVTDALLAGRAKATLKRGWPGTELVVLPELKPATSTKVIDTWLVSPAGPAASAAIAVVSYGTNPLLPAGKIEACIHSVARGGYSLCMPARKAQILDNRRVVGRQELVDTVRVFNADTVRTGGNPALNTTAVKVTLLESLDAEQHDEFVLLSALVESKKI